MKIYAVRDRLIDYFMQPFVGQSDKQVLSALSETINRDHTHAIQAAPHHFEVWELGEVDEDTGEIRPKRQLLADCASLVRASVRTDPGAEPGGRPNGTTAGSRTGPAGGDHRKAVPGERGPADPL